jgi:hypothetical protein
VKTLIRKLVLVSSAGALSYILAFVGILSSIAADAGYLVLLPLAGSPSPASAGIRWPGSRWATPRSPAPSPSTC